MNGFLISRLQKNRIQVAFALVLLVALLIPQLSWAAELPADAPRSCTGSGCGSTADPARWEAACSHYADLIELYRTGQLEFHAPGR